MSSIPRISGSDIVIVSGYDLGRGSGLSEVYHGRQLSTGLDCVVKMATTTSWNSAVLREARILARIPSNHVPRLLRIGDTKLGGVQWFATELIRGKSLDAVAGDVGLDVTAAIGVILDVCDALDAAHRRGIVHQNVRPDNVLVATNSHERAYLAHLLGFGEAQWPFEPFDRFQALLEAHLTRTGIPADPDHICITAYMAPERLDFTNHVTPEADVWALGLLAFYIFTGRHYWTTMNTDDVSVMHVLDEVILSPLDRASKRAEQLGYTIRLPEWFDDWFARCVSREIEQRFSTAGQAAQALADHYGAMVWTIALSANNISSMDLALSQLRMLAEDPFLRLLRVERGSIVLVLMGARKGFEKVRALITREVRPLIAGASVLSAQALDRDPTSARSLKSRAVDVFISYCPADMSFCDELLIHLSMMRRQGFINEWHERLLVAGSMADAEVSEWLTRCKLFVALLSADYVASDRCFERDLHVAIEKHHARTGCLVPIIVRACDWSHPPFSHLSTLPRDGTPISSWRNRDEAWADVVRDIRPIVESLRKHSDMGTKEAS